MKIIGDLFMIRVLFAMKIGILLSLILFCTQLSDAKEKNHGWFRRRPVAEKNTEPSLVDGIMERFSNFKFDDLKKEEAVLRNELTDLVNGLMIQSAGVIDQKTEAIKRALEYEKEIVREKLKKVQLRIQKQITETMNELGFQSTGMGKTTFVKGNQKIHIRFLDGKLEITPLD